MRRRSYRFSYLGPANENTRYARRSQLVSYNLLDNILTSNRAQRRLFRRFPHDRVATYQTNHRVPRPDCDRKVKRGDYADWPERVPVLGQPMAGSLTRNRFAV